MNFRLPLNEAAYLERCEVTQQLLRTLREQLEKGSPGTALLEEIEQLWVGVELPAVLSAEASEALQAMQLALEETTKIGSEWLTQTAEELEQLGRGRRMSRSYLTAMER